MIISSTFPHRVKTIHSHLAWIHKVIKVLCYISNHRDSCEYASSCMVFQTLTDCWTIHVINTHRSGGLKVNC